MKIAWFSCGITSAVACRLAVEKYQDVQIYYIEIGTAHPDNERFISECEQWFGMQINIVSSDKYKDQFEVIKDKGFVNSPFGAPCTNELKKKVRQKLTEDKRPENQIFGYEYNKKEINRAVRFSEQHPETNPIFPLIDTKLSKTECAGIMEKAGISLPEMYKLGFPNNNCIGCVKGGKGYWNKIRIHFPEIFEKMSLTEREVGASCINGTFLDELKEGEGNISKEIIGECGIFCSVEFVHILSPKTIEILEKPEK